MSEPGILMSLFASGYTAPESRARIFIVLVLSAGLLLTLLASLACGGWSGSRAEAQEAPVNSREWQWGWFVVFLLNLPLPLFFGFGMTSGTGTFGMIAGVMVVWLIGHRLIVRVPEIRGPFAVGGVIVAFSQVLPLVQIIAGASALAAITGCDACGVASASEGFAVTLLTAALLAVVALVIGSVLCAVIWLLEALERRIRRSEY